MASIVQRNKSFSVVYNIYDGDKKKRKRKIASTFSKPSDMR